MLYTPFCTKYNTMKRKISKKSFMDGSIFADRRVHLGYIRRSMGGRVKTRAARSEYLDDAAIRRLKPMEKAYSVFDDEIRGFFVRVLPSGTKSYGVRVKRAGAKKSYFYTLGETSSHSNEYARGWAIQTRDAVKANRDPRRESITKNTGITFQEAFELCMAYKLKRGSWSVGTAAKYARQFERHMPSRLKKQLLKEVDFNHLSEIHEGLEGTPAEGNRLRSMLKVLFAHAERKGWRPIDSNVADLLEPHTEIAKTIPNGAGYALADGEYAAVMAYFDQAIDRRKFLLAKTAKGKPIHRRKKDEFLPDIFILYALKFIALTGLRHSEPLRLKWKHIIEDAGIIRIEDAKNGFQTKDITPELSNMLAEMREVAIVLGRDESGWVFPSRKTNGVANGRFTYGPVVNLEKPWLAIRETLGLGKSHLVAHRKELMVPVRIHDLRHTYGTMAYAETEDEKAVQGLMNHKHSASTKIYIHLREEKRKQDALAVGAAMREKTKKKAG